MGEDWGDAASRLAALREVRTKMMTIVMIIVMMMVVMVMIVVMMVTIMVTVVMMRSGVGMLDCSGRASESITATQHSAYQPPN